MSDGNQDHYQRFLRPFTMHESAVRAFVRRLVPTRGDADDVMQEVAIVLWEKFDEFRDGEDFKAWACGIARYKALAWMRDKGRDRLVLSTEVVELIANDSLRDESHLHKQRLALETCLQKVAPEERRLLVQAYQADAKIQDVAKTSGRSVGGFYQWLHRMRQMLLECIYRQIAQESSI